MKRHFQIMTLALVAILTACTSQEPAAPAVAADETQSDAPTHSSIRTVDEAAAVARHSLSMLPQSDSRSGITRSFDKNAVKVATRQSQSRSGETDTLMYVFNFDDNQGFAVVAADSRVKPLIAVTEMGCYDPDSIPDNPGLAMYMDAAETLLSNVADGVIGGGGNPKDDPELFIKPAGDPTYPGGGGGGNSGSPIPETKEISDTTWTYWIHPNYDLRWGQRFPEGIFCDNGTAGCSNIGCFIAMAYMEIPKQLTLTYSGSNNATIDIDWVTIKRHKESFDFELSLNYDGCGYKAPVHTTIGQICRELGERNGTTYNPNSKQSSTFFDRLAPTLRNMGMTVSNPADWGNFDPYLSIAHKKIVITRGENELGGHVWVVDGFNYWNVNKKFYYKSNDDWILSDERMTEFRYNHINWGWNGNGNGYFASFTWDPRNPYFYDDSYKPSDVPAFTNRIMYIIVSKE